MVDIRWRYHLTCLAFSQRRGDVHRDFTSVGDPRPVLPCGTRSCGQGQKPRETWYHVQDVTIKIFMDRTDSRSRLTASVLRIWTYRAKSYAACAIMKVTRSCLRMEIVNCDLSIHSESLTKFISNRV